MNHPSDLLVDLVDGSISPRDRAVVDAHLASCARCRHEVVLAATAREALRSLSTPDVPLGLGDAAIAEAEEHAHEVAPEVAPLRARGGRAEAPAWYRWAGAAAAAAAILLVVVVLPDVGVDDRGATTEAADAGAESVPTAASVLEVQDLDYDTALVQALALAYGTADGRTAPPDTEYSGDAAVPAADEDAFDEALTCVQGVVPDPGGSQPARLIAARFEGAPAYLAVYLAGPGAGQPADAATVWVVSRDTCEILSTTRASL